MSSTANEPSFGRRVGATVLAGVPGIVALVAYIYLTTPPAAVPAGLSLPLLAVLSGINPLLLLAVACALGAFAAPRVALRSHLLESVDGRVDGPPLRESVGPAVAVGVLGGVLVVLLDVVLAPFVARDLPQTAVGAAPPTLLDVLAYVPVRVLYGGVTEELMLRFGLMSALAYAGLRVAGRRRGEPGDGVMWAAIAISAVLFGVGHLPALAQAVDLTPALVARTILLNAVAGVLFGWLYWRRSLEAAMVAHAAFHGPLVALSLVQVAIL